MGAMGRVTYAKYFVAVMCSLSLLHASTAWLPLTLPKAGTGAASAAAAANLRRQPPQSTRLWSGAGEGDGGGGRPDLALMKRSFEGSMDNKLIMEYVTVSLKVRAATFWCDTCFQHELLPVFPRLKRSSSDRWPTQAAIAMSMLCVSHVYVVCTAGSCVGKKKANFVRNTCGGPTPFV